MTLRVQKHPKIPTRAQAGHVNGFLIPIYNEHDGFLDGENAPKQVYLTVCDPGQVKGPHLHYKRRGLFTCIRGNLRIIVRTDAGYEEYFSGEAYDFATIEVPPGTPAALQNIGPEACYVLNTPSPAWRPDDQDEHEVTFDQGVLIWPKSTP